MPVARNTKNGARFCRGSVKFSAPASRMSPKQSKRLNPILQAGRVSAPRSSAARSMISRGATAGQAALPE